MGNALHAGDGLDIAEMSAIESYSIGMTSAESRTTTDENSASVATRERQQSVRQNLTGTSDDRDIGGGGGGRLHSKSSVSRNSNRHPIERPGAIDSRPPRYESNYNMEGKEGRGSSPRYGKTYSKEGPQVSPRSAQAGRVATRYDKQYRGGDGSHTETSSAYHHGYRMQEGRDDQEDETYPEAGTYQEYEGYEYGYEKNLLNSYNSNVKSKNSHQLQQPQQSPRSGNIHIYDTTHHEETDTLGRDGISTLADIPPAETDMAYAGSEDEELTNEVEVVPKYHFEAGHNTGMSKDHYAMNETEKPGPNIQHQATEMTEQEREFRRSNYPYDETVRDPPKEPSIQEQQPEHDGIGSVPGSSFSTLTKTLTTYNIEDPAVFEKEQVRNLKSEIKKLQNAVRGDDEDNDDSDETNPAQRKLAELLRQQRLQEEKLQRQLEQLRIQKEKLQQLQEEKMLNSRDSRDHDKSLKGSSVQDQQGWSLPSRRKKQIDAKPSHDDSSKNVKTSVQSSRHQERTRRERLERARAKVMPLSPSRRAQMEEEKSKNSSIKSPGQKPDGAFNFDNIDDEEMSALEEKYANQDEDEGPGFDEEESTGTATGEVEGSFVPEYEDVPSHCKIYQETPAPFQENDLTTISASHFSNELNGVSTVSSIKDRLAGVDEQEDDYDERINGTFSSMDEEIDLAFVAKYDKAFNAFLDKYPALFDGNSELIQNLKVAKLQRILEASYQTECALEAELETPSLAKSSLEAEFQMKLKEASRQKAERSIQYRAELSHVKKMTKTMAGQLTWDMVQLSIKRADKFQKIKAELNSKDVTDRENLLAAMPDGLVADDLRKAMRVSTKAGSKTEQKELHHFQVNNAILASEVRVLQERVDALKAEAKRKEWVDSTLLRMDEKKLNKLKSRYQKKLGATF